MLKTTTINCYNWSGNARAENALKLNRITEGKCSKCFKNIRGKRCKMPQWGKGTFQKHLRKKSIASRVSINGHYR